MRVNRTAVMGVGLLAVGFAMGAAVDRGITGDWGSLARGVWAATILLLVMSGVISALVGFGLVSTATLAAIGSGTETRSPTLAIFIAVYAGAMLVGITSAVVLEARYGIDGARTAGSFSGLFFLVGASTRPWWVFATIRRLGWFAAIESDRTMRVVLGLVGGLLLVLAILGV